MNDNQTEVMVIPKFDHCDLVRAYTKKQSEAFHGRVFASTDEYGLLMGRVVGSFAYRFEDELKVRYALDTECKFADGWALWKGSLGRFELEEGQRAVLLTGKIADRVNEQLRAIESPSKKLVKDVTRAVARSQQLRVATGKGMGF